MKIHFASDHAGFELKKALIEHVTKLGHEVIDHGPMEYNEGDDYPDFITPCAQAVAEDTESLGIIAGFSGEGEAMCANRIKGIRATAYYGGAPKILVLSREHNNANILSLSQHFMTDPEAIAACDLWLESKFNGEERHVRRINKF